MTLMLPDFSRYKPDDVIRAEIGKKTVPVEIYHGHGKHKESSGESIGVLHGWLGPYTTRLVATVLAEHGHDVFAVNLAAGTPSYQSKIVHASAKASVEVFDNPTVRFMGHSRAVQALVDSALYQQHRDPSELTYVMSRINTIAGLGTNGEDIDLIELRNEFSGLIRQAKRSPYRTAHVLAQSAINFMSNPLGGALEGVACINYDARDDIQLIEDAGIPVEATFQLDDYVIRPPKGDNVRKFPGSHMTPIIEADIMLELAG